MYGAVAIRGLLCVPHLFFKTALVPGTSPSRESTLPSLPEVLQKLPTLQTVERVEVRFLGRHVSPVACRLFVWFVCP